MLLCDSNVWLALALSKHVHHRTTREWLETIHSFAARHSNPFSGCSLDSLTEASGWAAAVNGIIGVIGQVMPLL